MSQIITLQGWNHALDVLLKGGSQNTTWYGILFENDYTPTINDVMSSFPAAAGETTAYDGATRKAITFGAPAAGYIDNAANVVEFTMTAAKTIYGAAIVSVSTKGATTGILLAAGRFASPKARESGEVLRVTYGLNVISAE